MSNYNRYNCYSCGPCNNRNYSKCDNCSASCCIDNMNSHRELFNLNDDFNRLLNNARDDIFKKFNEIRNNLINSYGININNYTNNYYYYDWKMCLYNLREKRNEMNNIYKDKESKYHLIISKNENELKKLNLEHKNKIEELKQKFIKEKYIFENSNSGDENKMKIKLSEKELLIQNMKDINTNKESILNNYEKEELLKADLEYNKDINEIDKNYKFIEEKLDYTDNEIKLKKQYLDEIQKIKIYSKNPFYNNLITSFGLNTYLC